MIKAVIPNMVLVMSTVHVYSANILYAESLKSVKIASFVPKVTNGKRPVCQGQLEGKLKNLVGVFPITRFPVFLFVTSCYITSQHNLEEKYVGKYFHLCSGLICRIECIVSFSSFVKSPRYCPVGGVHSSGK